jgi:crotonobetainyl-CoA:carnitine CoA-transferase CaiB-like acyl-CoA transferase
MTDKDEVDDKKMIAMLRHENAHWQALLEQVRTEAKQNESTYVSQTQIRLDQIRELEDNFRKSLELLRVVIKHY